MTSAGRRNLRCLAHECRLHGAQSFGYAECYHGLKERGRRGEQLTAEELAFVGLYDPRPLSPGGWHQPDEIAMYELDDREELSSQDSAMLSALMRVEDVTSGMIGFLG